MVHREGPGTPGGQSTISCASQWPRARDSQRPGSEGPQLPDIVTREL